MPKHSSQIINGTSGDDTLVGKGAGETINGLAGNDILYGDSINGKGPGGNDTLNGGDGNDTLFGGQGNDSITGGHGQDFLSGNLGDDTFDFRLPAESGQTDATADHIVDFKDSEGDRIAVEMLAGVQVVYGETQGDATVTSVETAITWARTHVLDGSPANVVFVAGVNDGYLVVDQDNTGAIEPGGGDYAIVLHGLNNLSLFGPLDVLS
jgi:Ca2+-binding RTX toxin-like protein